VRAIPSTAAVFHGAAVLLGSMSDPDQGGGVWALLTSATGTSLVEIARIPAPVSGHSARSSLTERSVSRSWLPGGPRGTSPVPAPGGAVMSTPLP